MACGRGVRGGFVTPSARSYADVPADRDDEK